ncbi:MULTISPECIES: helix-turn-helix transcriptional regulator [unclassified Modestobacter]
MAATSTRTLRLLSLLQSRRHWSGADLAQRLGVSVRTLRRDVERLREIGYPVDASRGADGGYALAHGAALPPLVLDDDEAVALAVGLSAAAATSVSGVGESSLRALAKLVQVMPARLRRRVDAVRVMTESAGWGPGGDPARVDPEVLTVVSLACRDAERLAFGYTTSDGRAGQRSVEPCRVVALGRRWYLVGYDLDRTDWRVFRLDRVAAPRGTGARFAPRRLPAVDAVTFVRDRVAGLRTHPVEAVVHAPAAEVRRRVGAWAAVTAEGPDRCRVRLDVEDLDWAAGALAIVGVPFAVVSPPELHATLRALAERCTTAAG